MRKSVTAREAELVASAAVARGRAHTPRGGRRVGAAVRTAGDRVYTGCSIELSKPGPLICAGRLAVFCAVAAGETDIRALAVVAEGDDLPVPCGDCLEALAEFSRDAVVITANLEGVASRRSLDDLLREKNRREA